MKLLEIIGEYPDTYVKENGEICPGRYVFLTDRPQPHYPEQRMNHEIHKWLYIKNGKRIKAKILEEGKDFDAELQAGELLRKL
jgi:hypothetical protein